MKFKFIAIIALLIFAACGNPTTNNDPTSGLEAQAAKAPPTAILDTVSVDTIYLTSPDTIPYSVQPGSVLDIPISFKKTDGCYLGLNIGTRFPNGAKIEAGGVLYPYGTKVLTQVFTSKQWYYVPQYVNPPSDWRQIILSANKVNHVAFYVRNTGSKPVDFSIEFKDAPAKGQACNP